MDKNGHSAGAARRTAIGLKPNARGEGRKVRDGWGWNACGETRPTSRQLLSPLLLILDKPG